MAAWRTGALVRMDALKVAAPVVVTEKNTCPQGDPLPIGKAIPPMVASATPKNGPVSFRKIRRK
jgi:hypothetical protein